MLRRGATFAVVGLLAAVPLSSARAQESAPVVDVVPVRGLIDDPVADYILDRLAAAQRDDVGALVFEIDSPGALAIDVDGLIAAVEDSDVPVIAWVAPRDARADGVAAELAEAADLVFLGSQASTPATPDGSAASLQVLLRALDGHTVEATTVDTWDEQRGVLNVSVRFQQMGVFARLLHAVTSPEMALLLFLVGLFGLIFEAYNPGVALSAVIGLAALALSLYGLNALPVNWWGMLLIVAAVVALVYDVHVGGFGAMTLGGLLGVGLGARIAFPSSPDPVALSWWAVAAAVVGTLIFFVSVMTAALRVRLRRPVSADDVLIGAIGEAQTDIAPEGTVVTKGVEWRARTMETGIAAGSKVKVMASEGFVLLVEPLHDD